MTVEIPDKLYFKIGEVAALLNVKTHVLRYWESEFPVLQPVKSRSKQRLYRRKDVETALLIRDLLYRQGFTIAGARKKLNSEARETLLPEAEKEDLRTVIAEVRQQLLALQYRLQQNPLQKQGSKC